MKNLLLKITLIVATLSAMFAVPVAANAAALNCSQQGLTAKKQIQCGACGASGTTNCNPGGAPKTLSDTIATIINIISIFGGALAVIMIIIGGMRYITSAGSPEGAKGARNTIVYAVVGLIIVAIAQIIVHFVINSIK